MGFDMSKLGAALVVASALASVGLTAGSASAAPPEMGCFVQGGSMIFPVGTPGTDEFDSNRADCLNQDKYRTHVAPIA
jgi:hypothetical protein